MRGQISRWGNSLGLRIPSEIARKAGLSDGSKVEIEAEGTVLVIRRAQPRLRYSLDGLMAGFTPELCAELRDAAEESDLGPEVGREFADE